jgi:O-phosphoseryl-tRNA(Cys) synthetase
MRKQDSQKKLTLFLVTNDIPGARQILLHHFIRVKKSSTVVMDMLDRATNGLYSPKQYDEKEIDNGILMLCLGSHRLLFLQNQQGLVEFLAIQQFFVFLLFPGMLQ